MNVWFIDLIAKSSLFVIVRDNNNNIIIPIEYIYLLNTLCTASRAPPQVYVLLLSNTVFIELSFQKIKNPLSIYSIVQSLWMIMHQKRKCKKKKILQSWQTWLKTEFYSYEKLFVERLYRFRVEDDTETPAGYVPK